MKILFLCTAHNSLTQRLYLALAPTHDVTIEFAISDDLMISAAELSQPDIIICPFLTARVPKALYDEYLTLIVHPGPPGDVGPSALDWVLLGDNGTVENSTELLKVLDNSCQPGRSHWGVTVLQAIEEFDEGPVWAFEQFSLDIDQHTKSSLYRGPVSRAAISAVLVAVKRIQDAARASDQPDRFNPHLLKSSPDFKHLSVEANLPFQGGRRFHRPLLKAAQRDFDVTKHTAQQIARRIRCGDSQPGAYIRLFGTGLYVYGGVQEDGLPNPDALPGAAPGTIVGVRNQAVCIVTCDGKGVWITHIRRPKKPSEALWPKVPAVSGLIELGLLAKMRVPDLLWPAPVNWSPSPRGTFQEVWVEFCTYSDSTCAAFLHWEFYSGAMSTSQCSQLVEAMDFILSSSTATNPIRAVVLMGGSYFSNGIALNVIEANSDPSSESWSNINRIDDVVQHLLLDFPRRNILTIAAVRGNAAAGGVALAAACDVVIAGSEVVLNPAYRGIGLFGSEFHTLSYFGRCGEAKAQEILRSMMPMSAIQARSAGLVDHILHGHGVVLDERIRTHVRYFMKSAMPGRGLWKVGQDLSASALAMTRTKELGEMVKDFYSARATRYHSRRFNFVRKVKPKQTPLRFAEHRRFSKDTRDIEESDEFDDVDHYERLREQELIAKLQSQTISPKRSTKPKPTIEVSKKDENETVFACYYNPVENSTMTPPLSPPMVDASFEGSAKEVPVQIEAQG